MLMSRPNAVPANFVSLGERIEQKNNSGCIKNGWRQKHTVVDICDCCNKYLLMPKRFLFLRKKGWRFMHHNCYKKTFGDDDFNKTKERKIIIAYHFDNAQNKKENQ